MAKTTTETIDNQAVDHFASVPIFLSFFLPPRYSRPSREAAVSATTVERRLLQLLSLYKKEARETLLRKRETEANEKMQFFEFQK